MSLKARLKSLERVRRQTVPKTIRVIVRLDFLGPAKLADSTCNRTRLRNGVVTEMVDLDGSRQGISEEELDAWVAGFPINV
jgi:hypothetical protein